MAGGLGCVIFGGSLVFEGLSAAHDWASGKSRAYHELTKSDAKGSLKLLGISAAVLVVGALLCGLSPKQQPGSSESPGVRSTPVVDYVDSCPLDRAVFGDLAPGESVGHFVYVANPADGADPVLYGLTYPQNGGRIAQRWQQAAFWPAAGVDTIWIWEGMSPVNGGWRARTITKFVPSDPEWGLVIESNPTVCRPRLGATWKRSALPLLALGSSLSHVVRR